MTITVTEEVEPIYSLYLPREADGWRKIYHVGEFNAVIETISPRGYRLQPMMFPDARKLGSILDIYRPEHN